MSALRRAERGPWPERRRGPAVSRRAILLIALVALTPAASALAQAPDSARAAQPNEHRVVTFSPRSGPPGTEVTVTVRELPVITPVYLTLGGTGSGFEVLGGMRMTSLEGGLSDTVRIPEWASRDQVHLFIVMDVYFGHLTSSEPFFVTGPDGSLVRKGRVEKVEGGCWTLLGGGGERYLLTGELGGLRDGAAVEVKGTLDDSGACGEGVTLRVRTVRGVERSPPSAPATPAAPASSPSPSA